ncbi:TetR/AcrR family transcriptional regulator [Mycobacterium sp. AMU20-3851]|uniref:TetR/AcrR family transcriptional regulator n=1 Tax=Mycobacterium sp. AMU20-3851 TaxID=3122055 RepID=UPI003754262D
MADAVKKRMSKDRRHAQLLDVAQELIRADGSDALTLARIAERAGVAKPLVYNHFGTRAAVLAELYRAFDDRQHAALDAALSAAPGDLVAVAQTIADAYIGCARSEGTELPGLVAALAGSPELDRIRREADQSFGGKCRSALLPFARSGEIPDAAIHAMLGAADALARAVIAGEVSADSANAALATVIAALVEQAA